VPIVKKEFPLPLDGFLLYNVISPSECEYYVEQTEIFGYEKLIGYKPDHRDNQRIVIKNEELCNLLFERIKPFLPPEIAVPDDSAMKMTAEFGTQGKWQVLGLNECWRFCRYYPGGHFAPHYDGAFARSENERSLLTFMIYLNGGFEGGETNFLENDQLLQKNADGKYQGDANKILESIVPEPGLALIFLHPQMHEGARLKSGVKYILRSDIMYRRVEVGKSNKEDEEAMRMYREATEIENQDPLRAAQLYRLAFKKSKNLAAAYNS